MSRILFIEPQIDLGRLLVQAFSRSGYSADHATNAQRALHLADQNIPDVIVLELNLVGHNGLEFLYELRSHADWKNVPVIIYSHVAPTELPLTSQAKNRLGLTAHLYKPTSSLEKLEKTIRGVVLEPAY